MLQVIGSRLDQIQQQVEHFGLTHENVVASFGGLYQDTLSTFRQRIQVQGDMRHLQQSDNAAKIRALLLSGIRSARLWRQQQAPLATDLQPAQAARCTLSSTALDTERDR